MSLYNCIIKYKLYIWKKCRVINGFGNFRDSLVQQLQLALAKAESEHIALTIAEEQLADVEKEKTVLRLEIKELVSRHKNELNKKENMIVAVSIQLC